MNPYYLSREFHTMRATTYNGRPSPAAEFFFAIRRRADNSLVFRAKKPREAEALLWNLNGRVAA